MNSEKKISLLRKRNEELEKQLIELKNENARLVAKLEVQSSAAQAKITEMEELIADFGSMMADMKEIRNKYTQSEKEIRLMKKAYSDEVKKELKRIKRED